MALEFYDLILEAAADPQNQAVIIEKVDHLLVKIHLYIRLSHNLKCMSTGQLEHAARLVDELVACWMDGDVNKEKGRIFQAQPRWIRWPTVDMARGQSSMVEMTSTYSKMIEVWAANTYGMHPQPFNISCWLKKLTALLPRDNYRQWCFPEQSV